jgi:hypothetical protein
MEYIINNFLQNTGIRRWDLQSQLLYYEELHSDKQIIFKIGLKIQRIQKLGLEINPNNGASNIRISFEGDIR